jgi:hypothetical protein
VRKGSTASWVGDHSQTTLWQIDKNLKSETGHGRPPDVSTAQIRCCTCGHRRIEMRSSHPWLMS